MFSAPDVAVILGVALLIFGPGKLPEIGASLGKGLRSFKKATDVESLSKNAEQLESVEGKESKTRELEYQSAPAEGAQPQGTRTAPQEVSTLK